MRLAQSARGVGEGEALIVGAPVSRKTIVTSWMDAFNARDSDGILAALAHDVDVHPLRLAGIAACYRGPDGVREWFGRVTRLGHECRIALREAREFDAGRVCASGSLSLAEESDIGPFFALHRLERGLVVAAHQYHTDTGMAESWG